MYKGHHVLWERRLWKAHDKNQELREKPGLIIPLDSEIHSALHNEIAGVPPPCYRLGNAILAIYRDNPDNHLRSMENFMRATEDVILNPRVRPIERLMGEVMIAAVEAQIPFIKEGQLYG